MFSNDADDFVIYVEKTRIIQVISNLICNSIKFISREEGEEWIIDISIEKRKNEDYGDINKDSIIISIKDNGKGIDK